MMMMMTNFSFGNIQGDSGGKISIFGGDNIRHCGEKLLMWTLCLILYNQRDGAISISKTNTVRYLLLGLDEERSLGKKGGYTRRTARWHFGWCCPNLQN